MRTGALLVVGLVVVGAALGVVWNLIAPLVEVRVADNGDLRFVDVSSPQEFISSDGWYAVLVAIAGLVTGIVVWWRARSAAFGALIGLAVGGVLASVVMWRVGVQLGPPDLPSSAGLEADDVLEAPRRLGAKGLLALWPAIAVGVYLALDLIVDERPQVSEQSEPWTPSSP